jgi:hypothetical protein
MKERLKVVLDADPTSRLAHQVPVQILKPRLATDLGLDQGPPLRRLERFDLVCRKGEIGRADTEHVAAIVKLVHRRRPRHGICPEGPLRDRLADQIRGEGRPDEPLRSGLQEPEFILCVYHAGHHTVVLDAKE